jgi:RNA polymerase sigma-70 factor (ECF subfamily)
MTDRPAPAQREGVESPGEQVASLPAPQQAAFRTLFEEHFAYVWRALRRLGVREADREDLAHEVFVTFYRRRDDYDPARAVRPWLFGIAFRVAVAHRRRAHQKAEVLEDGLTVSRAADEAPLPDQHLARRQDHALLAAALEAVDLPLRAVLVMHDLDGIAVPEIAASLGIPVNTAYSRLRLAREELRTAAHRLKARRR